MANKPDARSGSYGIGRVIHASCSPSADRGRSLACLRLSSHHVPWAFPHRCFRVRHVHQETEIRRHFGRIARCGNVAGGSLLLAPEQREGAGHQNVVGPVRRRFQAFMENVSASDSQRGSRVVVGGWVPARLRLPAQGPNHGSRVSKVRF